MRHPPVKLPEDIDDRPKESELSLFFKMFIKENERIDIRMLALENKFDRLLETVDGRMEQLITILGDKSTRMIPVDIFSTMLGIFGKILLMTIVAIFVAIYGPEVVIGGVRAWLIPRFPH